MGHNAQMKKKPVSIYAVHKLEQSYDYNSTLNWIKMM